MPVEYLYPSSTDSNNWTITGAASAHQALDDIHATYDDSTTMIECNTAASRTCICSLGNLSQEGIVVTSVQLCMRAQRRSGSVESVHGYCRVNGSDYLHVQADAIDTWVTKTSSSQTSPDTGLAWIVPEVNGSKVKGYMNNTTNIGDLSALHLDVTYVFAGGGFAYLIGQWLPPLLAVASHGLLKREVASVLSRLRIRPCHKEDFARIFEALRRRPAYGFHFGN